MDGNRNQRVLWLLNHTTLREFEVPLLRRLGLEVYCPKHFPRNPDNRSASVSYEFDSSLTLPESELRILNEFDFYSQALCPKVRQILNERFASVIVAYMFPMFQRILESFQGRILLRVFGSTHPTYTYYSFAREVASPAFERQLARVADRFWFAQAYPNLKSIEPPIFQRRSVDLPLGLPDRVTGNHQSWTGGDPRILFVCPEIESYQESKQIYVEFKEHFGDLGHVICGAQSKPHPDAAVLGKVDAVAYDGFFKNCNVMFYHSRLPRHIHYHPLEAICYGMPVVYMQQGMLGQLTNRKLPGACDTIQEARDKVGRLIRSQDRGLERQIRDSQQEIYRLFTQDYALERWNTEFIQGVLKTPLSTDQRFGGSCCRLGLLPLSSHRVIHEACQRILRLCKHPLKARLGTLQAWQPTMDTSQLTPFSWKTITMEQLRYAQRLSGHAQAIIAPQCLIPDDGICDFMDCDAWMIVGDRCTAPIATVKPYAFFYIRPVQDGGLSETTERCTAEAIQNARCVLVETPEDRDHLVRQYGVSQDWIITIDSEFDGETLWTITRNIP